VNRRYAALLVWVTAFLAVPVGAQTPPGDDGIQVARTPVAEIPAQYRADAARPRKPFAVRYTCPDAGRLYVVFDNAAQTATIETESMNRYLRQAVSASGARYVNSDESYVFWVKGNKATINGKEVCDAD
jgi:membrane-bound inhibitor of C-type lysozyme